MEYTENASELPVGAAQVKKFMEVLRRYKAGKTQTENRIISSENWWKLRNTSQQKAEGLTKGEGFTSQSGWLHNVIVSKHADALEAYPEPNILPREPADVAQAKMLSAIVPCVLEQNRFEQVYSDVMWQKLKTGTGVYKVVWDSAKLGGLGDITVAKVSLLNLYWEPGITDIQSSRYLFHTQLEDKELLQQTYPFLAEKLSANTFASAKFLNDDPVDDSDKVTVIEVYYRKKVGLKQTLQYCKFVGETVLFATENDPEMASRGLYDHGMYPYVFDTLYPIEGSPCGYGYVDLCRNPQTEIDLLKSAFVRNARVGAVPRYFSRVDGNVNAEQFLDLEQPLVQVTGNVDEASLREIRHSGLDGSYLSLLDRTIDELRQVSGNTEAATGAVSSGVTAASAIAALQEAAGKGSRDATRNAYRAFSAIVEMCIELIRQFYTLPRQFRITGDLGEAVFVSYQNDGLQPVAQSPVFGVDAGFRLPVFDIKVSAQRKSVYTKVSQNELALQFFQLGFFNPMLRDQALQTLEMMDFDGKEKIQQQLTAAAASLVQPGVMGERQSPSHLTVTAPFTKGHLEGESEPGEKPENAIVRKARERSLNAAQPR